MEAKVKTNTEKIKAKKKFRKIIKLSLLALSLILVISYVVVSILYNSGNFTVTLDKNLYSKRSLIIYDDPNYKVYRSELYVTSLEYFDNISYKWLPTNLEDTNGSHNGENYVAYTFYIENTGDDVTDYWAEIFVDDVIKNLDGAIRLRLYKNGEYVTYAKIGDNGMPEKETTPFKSDEIITQQHEQNFKPGDINKYTIVIWLEGNDSDCNDNILGGEIKMHMEFNSEITKK
jgi:hypothetical protein